MGTKAKDLDDRQAEVLHTWADLGAALTAAWQRPVPTWAPVTRMIEAAKEKLADEAKRLRSLLDESRKRLHPLEDPFDLDLGVHRWLAAEREEAYSDWLAWVVEQLQTPRRVFQVFGLDAPKTLTHKGPPTVQREVWVEEGHVGCAGRLDLVIRFGNQALIVVEVKKVGAEESDTEKHCGYGRWVDEQPEPNKERILLAPESAEQSYEGFGPVHWKTVCANLRRIAPELCQERRVMVAAMMLAFVGAVEQNLLGYSASVVRRVRDDRTALFSAAIGDYLKEVLYPEGE